MKDKTLKLSGHAKDRFIERFFAEERGISGDVAHRLAARGKATFVSLRVRKLEAYPARTAKRTVAPPAMPMPSTKPTSSSASSEPAPTPAAFDPYAFGLVPIFQREGRDGLLAKLSTIGDVDHLRQMAKAQQIVMPSDMRSGPATADAVRGAIADAVAKRIADRRAAAG